MAQPDTTLKANGRTGPLDAASLTALEWRLIGPHRGGRVLAVAGDVSDPLVFYFGATGGGVWKSADAGVIWRNISDGYFGTGSVGALAVSASDPNVIYAGMGEPTIRSNVSYGDGVYKSTDRGETWTHLGLVETRQIARIQIHPSDPDIVYVAALGHAFGPNPERGVYRSRDGGQSWELILHRSAKAGAIDLSIDPQNPRIIYAAFWQIQRMPHDFTSGGPDSSLYKSSDGGDTWTELTNSPGLPEGLKGKIGVAVSPAGVPSGSGRVWAMIEAEQGGLYRSDNGGASWQLVSGDPKLQQRPFYYTRVFADPLDADTVWLPNYALWKSVDGGHSFTAVDTPHVDNHVLWIDPHRPQRMIAGHDGGACVSFNGGLSWSSIYNQPTAELYHVTTDTHFPYRVYGAQQDSTTICVPSLSFDGAITQADWFAPGGGESGYISVTPDDPEIVYAGTQRLGVLTRYDRRLNQAREIAVWPESGMGWAARDLKYRFNRTFPVLVSPHDSNLVYVGGNRLFQSTNEGQSWELISPDLTRNELSRQGPAGGSITPENTGVEYYGTLSVVSESAREPGVLWTGSDDGKVFLSRDRGATWNDLTPAELPEWSFISSIDISTFEPGTVYLAATRYKLDDYAPYLYRTDDYGATWQAVTHGIPDTAFTRVLREDPNLRGLLYAGTETGLYVSFDNGDWWQPFQNNLPITPLHDLVIQGSDLVVATHGRSFWVLDDLSPLHQLTEAVAGSPAHLFEPRPAYRLRISYVRAGALTVTCDEVEQPSGGTKKQFLDAGENPPDGVLLTYFLADSYEGDVQVDILDNRSRLLRTYTSSSAATGDAALHGSRISKHAGANRFVWDLRVAGPDNIPGDPQWERRLAGPRVPPGLYQVRMTASDQAFTKTIQVLPDPRLSTSQADYDAQFALLLGIRDKLSEAHQAVTTIRAIRRQVDGWESRAHSANQAQGLSEAAQAIQQELLSIESELVQVKARSAFDRMRYEIKANYKLSQLFNSVSAADAQPTRQAGEVFDYLAAQVDEQSARLQILVSRDVADFNQQVKEMALPAIVIAAS